MIAANLAVVHKVLPEKHGVLVTFRSGVSFSPADTGEHFVRVLATRAHPTGGSSIMLPEVGELGVVLDVDEGISVWIGSLHWLQNNQAEPTLDLWSWTHQSGLTAQLRPNGDFQLDHASGLRVRFSSADEALPEVKNSSAPNSGFTLPVFVEIWHPSNAFITINEAGAVEVYAPRNITLTTDQDLLVNVKGDMTAVVDGNATATVGKDLSVSVGGNLSAAITGKATATVGGDLAASVDGAGDISVGGALNVTSGGDATIKAPKIHLKS